MRNLTEGNIYKSFILFAIPMVLSGMLSEAYSTVDTIIAGKYIGGVGLAATGATSALITMLSCIFSGYGTGVAVYIARLFGAGEKEKIRSCVINNYGALSVAAILIGLLGIVFADPILSLLRVSPEIHEATRTYFSIIMAGYFLIRLNVHFTNILCAFGASSFPLVMSVVSAVLNVAGNIVSVAVLGWGVAGLALSTVFSALVVDICYFFKVHSCFKQMGVSGQPVYFDRQTLSAAEPYSLPTAFQQMIMHIPGTLVSPLVNGIGASASAAYTVVMRVYNFNQLLYGNSTKATLNYVSQATGAGKFRLIKRGLRVGFVQNMLFLLPALLLCLAFPDEICSLFFKADAEPQSVSLAVMFIKYFLPFIVFNAVNNLFHSLFRGMKSMRLMVLSTTVGTVVHLVMSWILVGKYGMYGVYAGWAISWVAESVFVAVVYFAGLWKSDEYRLSEANGFK